jgi:transposase InsO family protein
MLTTQISAIHSASRDTYGAPRIHAELAAKGVACSHNTVAKLMRQAAIRRPNDCWLSDIPTREGWLYLAVILDMYSRAIVGWAMSRALGDESWVQKRQPHILRKSRDTLSQWTMQSMELFEIRLHRSRFQTFARARPSK